MNTAPGNPLQLDNDTFVLQQFHFHSPGENEISGRTFPLEAHFVYKDSAGALAVVALLFRKGKENQQIAMAWRQLPSDINRAAALTSPVDIRKLLPGQQGFYRFDGSLTTPPCSEGVRWIVLKQTRSVSDDQIALLHKAVHGANNRPVQPLDGRIIVD